MIAIVTTLAACSTPPSDKQRSIREQRENAERERRLCAMIDHCDMGLLDMDQELAIVEQWANESCLGIDRWSSNVSLAALRKERSEYVYEQEIRVHARHVAISRVSRTQHCPQGAPFCEELMRAVGREARIAEKELRARRAR